MIDGNLQYVADCLLIEKMFLIDAGINKKAGVADGLLGSISGSIMDWAKQHIDTESGVSGVVSSLTDIMVPGVLFKINPILGGLGTVAQVLGFSPSGIIKKIMQFVYQKLSSGTLPTLDEINNIGKGAVAAEAGPITVEAGSDMLDLLHEVEKRGQLVRLIRTAQRSTQTLPEISFFGGEGGVIERIFGQLFKMKAKGKAKWLLGGFVVWIIKTILLGAGLIAAGEKVTSLFDDTLKPSMQQVPKDGLIYTRYDTSQEPSEVTTPTVSSIKLTPTGRGQDIHVNDHKTSTWIVPMIGGSVEDTLLAWAGDVYKELVGREEQIVATEAFNKTVEQIKQGLDGSKSGQLTIPSQFKSRKQIVDQFASDINI